MSVSIKDVANKAGVSISTVSKALNDKSSVSSSTIERIKQTAEDMGYVPNSRARVFATKETKQIVFIADYIEPGRNKAKNLSEIRKMAFRDLNSACKMILEDTLEYLKQGEGETDPMTEQTYKYYCEEINNESEID